MALFTYMQYKMIKYVNKETHFVRSTIYLKHYNHMLSLDFMFKFLTNNVNKDIKGI